MRVGGVCDIPAIADVCQTVGSGVVSLVATPFDWLAHTLGAVATLCETEEVLAAWV